jgi:nitrite reductase/ring-hydroxylating ferredoxin subunit
MKEARHESEKRWPRYAAAADGLRNYWYPVMWSRSLRHKAVRVQLCGEAIMLIRDRGRAFALRDECPHRGVPLSAGRQEFIGSWSCRYHGWTFDLETGVLKAALTDGPASPICGKAKVQAYPVEERAGLVWVYVGEQPAPPAEADIPSEFLQPDTLAIGRISVQRGNWRFACENGFDDGHSMFLHRYGALFSAFRRMPAWRRTKIVDDGDGWISRDNLERVFQSDYPELGSWPRKSFWKRRGKRNRVSIRLPGVIRNRYAEQDAINFVWWTPIDRDHYRMVQIYVTSAKRLQGLLFSVRYWFYLKPIHHIQFNNQDAWMVRLMPDTPPDRLYRPDASIIAWRKLCETARGRECSSDADKRSPQQIPRVN